MAKNQGVKVQDVAKPGEVVQTRTVFSSVITVEYCWIFAVGPHEVCLTERPQHFYVTPQGSATQALRNTVQLVQNIQRYTTSPNLLSNLTFSDKKETKREKWNMMIAHVLVSHFSL